MKITISTDGTISGSTAQADSGLVQLTEIKKTPTETNPGRLSIVLEASVEEAKEEAKQDAGDDTKPKDAQ